MHRITSLVALDIVGTYVEKCIGKVFKVGVFENRDEFPFNVFL